MLKVEMDKKVLIFDGYKEIVDYLKSKDFSQIKDMPNSFVAADDIKVGNGNKIPLWLFGFVY